MKSLEDKAKEYVIKVHGSHPNDQTVRDNLAFDYVTIYRQALKDMVAEAERWNTEKIVDYQNQLRTRGAKESSQLIQHLKNFTEDL